jgi:hypothetical protein
MESAPQHTDFELHASDLFPRPRRWPAGDGDRADPSGGAPDDPTDRQAAIEALAREAEEYGADAVIDVRFEVDGVKGPDIEGVALERVTATGLAVRFARAA